MEAASKASNHFIALLWRLASEYRAAQRIHIILDNASVHTSKKTQKALAQSGGRVVLHLLPPYCPDANRIKRVWLDLHATDTRNHRCLTMSRLMEQVHAYLATRHSQRTASPCERTASPCVRRVDLCLTAWLV